MAHVLRYQVDVNHIKACSQLLQILYCKGTLSSASMKFASRATTPKCGEGSIRNRQVVFPLVRPLLGNLRLNGSKKVNTLPKVSHCQFHTNACLCSSDNDNDGCNKSIETSEETNTIKDVVNKTSEETDTFKDVVNEQRFGTESNKVGTHEDASELESGISEREKEDIKSWIADVDKTPDKESNVRNNELLRLPEDNLDVFLDDRGIIYDKGHTCHHTVCPKLGKLAMKKRQEGNKMFINSLTGKLPI